MPPLLQQIEERLDLETAVIRASRRNDLLPPRPDDGVGGEVGRRFSEALRHRIVRGRYEPDRAYFVHIPKRNYSTRPAALMTLADRTIYEALVGILRERIEQLLLGPGVVMWPRAEARPPRWPAFESSPLITGATHVVVADVAGFYDQIPHMELGDTLIQGTGLREEAEALVAFLDRVMGSPRGLPQGLEPSDALATAYLSAVDAALAREGFHFARHGDDIRIAAPNYSEARRALFVLGTELRKWGLMLNASKSFPMRRETYEDNIEPPSQLLSEAQVRVVEQRLEHLKDNEEALTEAIQEAGLEELGWALFYHFTATLDEVIDALRPQMTADAAEVAIRIFRDAVKRAPGENSALSEESFHRRLTLALVRLSAAENASVIDDIGHLLIRFPDKTQHLVAYLMAVRGIASAAVVQQVELALFADEFKTGWQLAQLLRVLSETGAGPSTACVARVQAIAHGEDSDWLSRVAAAQFLASRGLLDRDLARRLYNLCPAPFRADLIAAVLSIPGRPSWADGFLATAQQDPVHVVVLRHSEQQHPRQTEPG